ncbi:unnamed protein product, partial [Brenthis ino]
MGGCRCTYRNCTVKSDGKTHMFHYPVFEKVRCHQWLVNAQRLDFLNLKVSQLKNRVVCQHHFKEENFMNYKKDKLTFDAIPTENGPFCDPSKFEDQSKDFLKAYPNLILLEDIENEVIFNDKKANYSLKYGDFLTNGELMDSSSRHNYDISLTRGNTMKNERIINNEHHLSKTDIFKPRFTRLSLPTKNINKSPPQPTLIVPPYTDLSSQLKAGNEINQDLGIINTVQTNVLPNNSFQSNVLLNTVANNSVIKKEPKIKILSEKKIKIQGPLPIIGQLKKVSPSTTLNLPDKSNLALNMKEPVNIVSIEEPIHPVKIDAPLEASKKTNNKPSKKLKVLEVLDIEVDSPKTNKKDDENGQIKNEDKEDKSLHTPLKSQKIKTKITPERSAAIEEKRKFNMRMKDILESCLDNLDDPVKSKETSLIKAPKKPTVNDKNSVVSTHLAKDQNLPNVQDYTLAFLDDRMKKMEKTLLNKIEQNSHRIMEIKDSLNKSRKKESNGKRYAYIKTGGKRALDAAKAGRTCVVFTHRLSTARNDADVICVLSDGRVAESGIHSQLVQLRGLYCNLLAKGL